MLADRGAASIAQPFYIRADGRSLFGWHHPASPDNARQACIVVCPPLGYEYMSSYRSARVLAERLAAVGYDVIRIDYDGTGNSAGDYDDPDRVNAWIRSIGAAIGEAITRTGSKRVALVGIRGGAMLAAQAAVAAGSVDQLVLWAPPSSGRSFVRELNALAGLGASDDAQSEPANGVLTVAGHATTQATLDDLAAWSVADLVTRPAREVLVLEREDRPAEPLLEARLKVLGANVTRVKASGTPEMLMAPHVSQLPEQAIDQIVSWFEARPNAGTAGAESRSALRGAVIHDAGNYREEALRFGDGDRLFGIVARPSAASTHPAVVLFSTGAGHNVGPHRLYVPLARQWASNGHVVLRFDTGGIGDSAPPIGAADNVVYPEHMLEDARAAIELVRREAPRRPVVVGGLCSGGWLAFLAAREGLAVDAAFCVNPPLYLRDGPDGLEWLTEEREIEHYQQSLRDASKWAQALRGRTSYGHITRVAAHALFRQVAARIGGARRDVLPGSLSADLCRIADRGVTTLFVFARGDGGLGYFEQHATAALRRPAVQAFLRHTIVDGAGHAFFSRSAQETLRTLLNEFVSSAGDRGRSDRAPYPVRLNTTTHRAG
jgi:alpha-beta hydrolase superfamily lysophospholipase